MKKLFACIILIALITITGCKSDNKKIKSTGEHPNHITGKVIEIKDNQSVLIEIIKDYDNNIKSDKVLVNYKEFQIFYNDSPDAERYIGKPELNDKVVVSYWPNDVTYNDEVVKITIDYLQKYIDKEDK